MQNTLRFNTKIIAIKRKHLLLIAMFFAFKRNLLRLNAKIIANKHNKKFLFLYWPQRASGLCHLVIKLNQKDKI